MAHRLMELEPTDPFGDKAILLSLSGREELSRPFEFHLEITSPKINLKPADVVGKPLAVRIDREDEDPRYVHGYVSHLWAGNTGDPKASSDLQYRAYRVRLVPWLWFMTRAARSFIFLPEKDEKSIHEIFDEVIKRVQSYSHVESWHDTSKAEILKKRKVEHCVQYRETDFNFLSRLLEQYGVFYYFRHSADKHELVLADKKNYEDSPESEVEFHPAEDSVSGVDHVTRWEHAYEFVSGKWEQSDYDFKNPSDDLKTNSARHGSVSLSNNSNYELYDYPAEYVVKDNGTTEAERRMEEEEIRFDAVQGASTCRSFSPGFCFKLSKHHSSPSEQGLERLITDVYHSAQQPGPFSNVSQSASYTNQFTCVPRDTQYRPQRLTPKPMVYGIQTATVAGPDKEEIYTDEFGRVKVHFHWDREGRPNRFNKGDDFSCWMRVAYTSAGMGWGMVAIPRVGQEVVVEFIEGDPDRPLVTGCIYNGEQTQHYPLPDERTKSYWKTNSSPGGDGYNELMFEDKAGEEKVFIHAQKDMDLRTLNETKQISLANQHQVVGTEDGKDDAGDYNQLIWRDNNAIVKRDQVQHIEGNQLLMVGNGDADGGIVEIVIEKKEAKKIGDEGQHLIVGGDSNAKVGGSFSVDAGGSQHLKAGGDVAIEAGAMGQVHIKASTIVIEAMMQLSLKAGANFIDLGPAGISIQGTMVNINSGGAPATGNGCSPTAPDEATEAAPAEAATAWDSSTGEKSRP